MSEETTLYCSFCGKSQHDVTKLIVGGTAMICTECVELCCHILIAERALKLVFGHREMLAGDIGVTA